MEPYLLDPSDRDLVITRATAWGTRGGKKVKLQAEILDYHDEPRPALYRHGKVDRLLDGDRCWRDRQRRHCSRLPRL